MLALGGLLSAASLTHETTGVGRLVGRTWQAICFFRPMLLGGCRPIRISTRLSPEKRRIERREIVTRFAFSSEVVVAARVSV
jgi:hypothetical protein